jgi:hypothetical protein
MTRAKAAVSKHAKAIPRKNLTTKKGLERTKHDRGKEGDSKQHGAIAFHINELSFNPFDISLKNMLL